MEGKVEQRTQAVIRLQKENVRLRVIEEKERIYGNLYDSFCARLTSININNHVARSAPERDENPVLLEMLDRIEKNTWEGDAAGPVELLDFIVNCEKIIQELVANTMKHSGAALV